MSGTIQCQHTLSSRARILSTTTNNVCSCRRGRGAVAKYHALTISKFVHASLYHTSSSKVLSIVWSAFSSLSYAKLHDLFILVRLLIFVPGKNIKQPKKLSLATIFTHSNGSSLLTRNLSASTTTFPESPFKVQTSFT